MSTPITFNGVSYSVPAYNDTGYAQGAGNLSAYLIAIATGTLQPSGGTFALTGDVNFGTNFGLISKYYTSVTANPATAGTVRLARVDTIDWRNQANGANLVLGVSSSNNLQWQGVDVLTGSSGGFVSSITGTANQVIASASTGAVTLSLPQSIATTSDVHFGIVRSTGSIISGNDTGLGTLTLSPSANTPKLIYTYASSGNSYIIQASDNPSGGNRIYTLADVGSDGGFVFTVGTQTINGNKTFGGTINLSALTASTPLKLDGSKNIISADIDLTTDVTGTLPVSNGGTGNTTFTAYSIIAAGTTATGPFQNVSGLGSSGQVLTSNGAGQLPTWQAVSGSGTVNAGTATHLAYYATSSTAVSDANGATLSGTYTWSGLNTYSAGLSLTGSYTGSVYSSAAIEAIASKPTSTYGIVVKNTSTTAASAGFLAVVDPASTGDAQVGFTVDGVENWALGIDNSASDAFVISNNAALGSSNAISISTAEVVTIPVQGIIHGTSTNDSAAAGFVGEFVESVIGTTSFTTSANAGNLTSISLTAGDWDVSGMAQCNANGASVTEYEISISTTSATLGSLGDTALRITTPGVGEHPISIPGVRISISGTTTVYLVGEAVYTVATPRVLGANIRARRVR